MNKCIKEPKPKIDGEETNFFECHKCECVRDYEKLSNSEVEKGCPCCQSKDFELKISLWNGILHYKIKECPKCHKMDMADLIKWPESDNTKGKSKEEINKQLRTYSYERIRPQPKNYLS